MSIRTLADLPFLDIEDPAFLKAPWLRAREIPDGLARSVRGLEVLSYRNATVLLRDPRLAIGFDEMYAASGFPDGLVFDTAVNSIGNVEGSHHLALRSTLAAYFTPAFIASLRPFVRSSVVALLDQLPDSGEFDLFTGVAEQVPARLFAHLIGSPAEDAKLIGSISAALLHVFYMDPGGRETIERAALTLRAYVGEVIERRLADPGPDVVSHLLTAESGGVIQRQDTINTTMALLRASSDTSARQLAYTVAELLVRPGVWTQLRNDPSTVSGLVLEATRLRTSSSGSMRVAREDLEILDVRLEAGTCAYAISVSAHRDPAVFDDPDDFVLDRPAAMPLLNWGQGRHFCLGRPIALVEIEEAAVALSEMLVDAELASEPPSTVDMLHGDGLEVRIRYAGRRRADR